MIYSNKNKKAHPFIPLTLDGVFAPVNHTYPVLTIEPVSTSVFKEQNCGLSYLSSQEGKYCFLISKH